MWHNTSNFILNKRIPIIIILIGALFFMVNNAKKAKVTYQLAKILPFDHKVNLEFHDFISEFGESQNTMVIAVQDDNFFKSNHLKQWDKLTQNISILKGVEDVVSITNLPILSYDNLNNKFITSMWYDSTYCDDPDNARQIFEKQKI